MEFEVGEKEIKMLQWPSYPDMSAKGADMIEEPYIFDSVNRDLAQRLLKQVNSLLEPHGLEVCQWCGDMYPDGYVTIRKIS